MSDAEIRIHNLIVESYRSASGHKPTRAECYELALSMLAACHPLISSGYVRRPRPSGLPPKPHPEAITIPGELQVP